MGLVLKEVNLDNIIKEFNGKPFAWWFAKNLQLTNKLYDLKNLAKQAIVKEIKQVTTIKELQDFILIMEPYDENAHLFYAKLTPELLSK